MIRQDKGQAAPLYLTAVVGLLFLALMYFAVGQADASRNGTQSAADSAALAAAQESRDQLKILFLQHALDGGWLKDILSGNYIGTYNGCHEAQRFANLNEAGAISCSMLGYRWGFSVDVRSDKSVGDSILPGTENKHVISHATAVVEPKCHFVPADDKPGHGNDHPLPDDNGGKPGDNDKGKKPSPGKIACDNRDWSIDPEHLDLLPSMADLFVVRLAEN